MIPANIAEELEIAGYSLNKSEWTDDELDLAITALEGVTRFLKEAGYSKWILIPLCVKQRELEGIKRGTPK